ncbi:hypothetical protein K710_0494 [Streptococcus iniae SF1]|nr:hypothetical protein K710_0494 [Streptococcus iniae SF1]
MFLPAFQMTITAFDNFPELRHKGMKHQSDSLVDFDNL